MWQHALATDVPTFEQRVVDAASLDACIARFARSLTDVHRSELRRWTMPPLPTVPPVLPEAQFDD